MVLLQVIGGVISIFVSALFLWIVSRMANLKDKSFGMALRIAAFVGIIGMSMNYLLEGALSSLIFATTIILSIILVKRYQEERLAKSCVVACIWVIISVGATMAIAFLLGTLLMGAGFSAIAGAA